jgi:2-octaprenylphenol hydroxylase
MNATENSEFDIVIAGAGMVGASLACLLASTSLRIALLDKQVITKPNAALDPTLDKEKFDPRVSAITQASKSLFEQLGVWEDIVAKRACSYGDMQVWDAQGTGAIHFSATDINQPELGNIVENSVITTVLQEKIFQSNSLQVISPFSLETIEDVELDGRPLLQLGSSDGQFIRASLVVAADGANSRIRQLANFSCSEWDYEHQALVTTVRTERPHRHTAFQRFLETGPLAFLPLRVAEKDDDQHFCSIVWSMQPEKAEKVMSLNDKEFLAELGAAIEFELGDIESCGKRFAFPLRQRHAIDYVKNNIVLVGDAAHTIHPLAGQGVNLGLLDAKVLAEELIRGIEAGRCVSDSTVLLRYQRKRKGHNLSMMWLMEGFKRLFAEKDLTIRWLRNVGMKSVDKLTPIKNQMIKLAMGLDS